MKTRTILALFGLSMAFVMVGCHGDPDQSAAINQKDVPSPPMPSRAEAASDKQAIAKEHGGGKAGANGTVVHSGGMN